MDQEESEHESEQEPPDAVTGLNISNYLIKKDFAAMMKSLENLSKDRQENNIVEQAIRKVARDNKVDPETFIDDMKRFTDKRAMIDAS